MKVARYVDVHFVAMSLGQEDTFDILAGMNFALRGTTRTKLGLVCPALSVAQSTSVWRRRMNNAIICGDCLDEYCEIARRRVGSVEASLFAEAAGD